LVAAVTPRWRDVYKLNTVDVDHLASWIAHRLPFISGLYLSPQNLRVTHVLNWGGFVNYSFSINDGSAQYHLKITSDLRSIRGLQRWHTLHSALEKRYRAPKLIQWIDFSEIGFAGLLFEHLNGRTANLTNNQMLLEKLIELADGLHRDQEIRSHLRGSGPRRTYLKHFVETYIDRFTGDLETVATSQLPFISSTLLSWMQDETGRLHEVACRVPAFQNPAIEAVHGDLNEGNILVTAKDWFVVDWDDLAIGDPAVDFAVLLWPIVREGGEWRNFFKSGTEEGFGERIEICFRAQLLDEVIDPLADYVEARVVPSQREDVQLVKRKRHEEALEKYRMTWRG
jgi:thiamine kinase-like enzyme